MKTSIRILLSLASILVNLAYVTAAFAQTETPTPTQTPTATPLPLNYGLLSCWDFEETSGTRYDNLGNVNLTDNNTVGYESGIIGNAAKFVSTDSEYLSAATHNFPTGASSRTILTWAKLPVGVSGMLRLSFYGAGATCKESLLRIDNTGPQVAFVGNGCSLYTQYASITTGTWYFVGYSYDGTNVILYFNNNASQSALSFNTAASTTYYLGKSNSGYSSGSIDQQAVWNRTVSSTDVARIYNGGAGLSCDGLKPTATPTPTQTPTATPTASGARQVSLSSGDWMTVKRETSYGDVAIIVGLGVIALALIVLGIIFATDRWLKQ